MDQQTNPATDGPRLDDYLRPILGRKWLLLAIVMIVTIATYGYYERQPKVYQASTQVFLTQASDPLTGTSLPGSDRNIQNQARLFQSREVLDRVAKDLRYQGDPQALASGVTASPSAGSDFIAIVAKSGDPSRAAQLANGFAQAFIDVGSANQQKRIAKAVTSLRSQLRGIPVRSSTAGERADIGDSLRQLQLAQETAASTASQIQKASVPGAAASPKPVRNALFAFALALIASVGLAFGLERFDRRLKRVEDAAELYGLPILTVLPHTEDINPIADGIPTVSVDIKEALYQLRSNLQLNSLDRPLRKILITSGLPGEGKSTVARNLAIVFREWGQSVAIVDADLRHPSLAKLYDTLPKNGLTAVLTGDCTLEEAMTVIPVDAVGLNTLEKIRAGGSREPRASTQLQEAEETTGEITFVGPGPRPANPPAVLAASRTHEAFDELLETHEIVLIDSAPLLAVSDTMALLPQVDAVILVSRLGATTKDSVRRTVEAISLVGDTQVAGVVVNDLSGLDSLAYGYGYGRAYGQGYGPKA